MFRSIKKHSSKSPGRHRRDRSCPGLLVGRSRSLTSIKTKLIPSKSAGPVSSNSITIPDIQLSDGEETSISGISDSDDTEDGFGKVRGAANASKPNGPNILDDFYGGSNSSHSFGRITIKKNIQDINPDIELNLSGSYTLNSSHDSGYQNESSVSTGSGSFSGSSTFTEESNSNMSCETFTSNQLNSSSSMTSFYDSRVSRTNRTSRTSGNSRNSKNSFRDSSIFGFDNKLIFSNTLLYGPSSHSCTDTSLSTESSDETTSHDSMTTDSNTLESSYGSSTCPSGLHEHASSQESGSTFRFSSPNCFSNVGGKNFRDDSVFVEGSSIEVNGTEEVRVQDRTADGSFRGGTAFSGSGDIKPGSTEGVKTQEGEKNALSVDSIDCFSGLNSVKSGSESGDGSYSSKGGRLGTISTVRCGGTGSLRSEDGNSGGTGSSAGGKTLGGSSSRSGGGGSRSFRASTPSDVSIIQTVGRARAREERDRPEEVGFEVLTLGNIRVTWYPSASSDAAVMKILGCGV